MKMEKVNLCKYGCGQKGKIQYNNGEWCCCESKNSCPELKKKNSNSLKGKVRSPIFIKIERKNSNYNFN